MTARRQAREDQSRRIEEVALAVKLALDPDWRPSGLVDYAPQFQNAARGPTAAMQLPGPKATSQKTPVVASGQNEPWWWGKMVSHQGRFVPVVPPQDHPLASEWHARYTIKAISPETPLPAHLAGHPDAPKPIAPKKP